MFSTVIANCVNIDAQPEIMETLSDGGMQLVRCTHCGAVWPLAEPIVIHQPEKERLAVFLPGVIAHKELEIRAHIMKEIADGDLGITPLYSPAFKTLVGVDSLQEWLFGEGENEDEQSSGPDLKVMSMIPKIHEAFADLDEPERSSAVSVVPREPQMEDMGDEPIFDEDWLKDEEISNGLSKSRSSSSPAVAKKGSSDAPSKRKPGVDFVGLMSEMDGEEEEEAEDYDDKESEKDEAVDPFGFDSDE